MLSAALPAADAARVDMLLCPVDPATLGLHGMPAIVYTALGLARTHKRARAQPLPVTLHTRLRALLHALTHVRLAVRWQNVFFGPCASCPCMKSTSIDKEIQSLGKDLEVRA